MTMSGGGELDEPLGSGSRRGLWLTKTALLVIGVGLCTVGRRLAGWPIVTWWMFSTVAPTFPPPHTSGLELRVVASTGDVHRLAPWEVLSMERTDVVERAIERAFDDGDEARRNADRAYLRFLVERRLVGVDVEMIQGWRLHWKVSPRALPPLDRDRPVREEVLGAFE